MMEDIQIIIDDIRDEHRQRNFMMEQRKRMNLALAAFLRMQLGWRKDLPEGQRKKISAKALDFIDIAERIISG